MSTNRWMGLCVLAAILSPALAGDYRQPIKWKEKNNEIIHNSVCFNHRYGSIKYRQCRVDAKKYFGERCKDYRERYDHTRMEYAAEIKKQKEKFCHSAHQFSPV